jgi:hypothetical protein
MNASMYDIDRRTHRKIVIVGSTAAMIVVAIAANARLDGPLRATATTAPAIHVMPPQRRQIIPPQKAPASGFAPHRHGEG